MFNSEGNKITSENNGLFSAEALKLMMNKRKSADNDEEIHQQNDNIKRLCPTNGDQLEQTM